MQHHPTQGVEGQDWILELELLAQDGDVQCLPSTIRHEEHDYEWSDELKELGVIQEEGEKAIELEVRVTELERADEHQEFVALEAVFQDDLEPQEE